MLKFLIIIFLVGFLLFKLLGLFVRVLVGGSATQKAHRNPYQNQSQQYRSRSNDGNVNIDFVPKDHQSNQKEFNGGEYVDYEEIK